MRFDAIRLQGISTAFPDPIEVDLRSITGLCAITGTNGAGKSTLLGCLAAAAYRMMPDGQKLTAMATRRDSYVEASMTNGESFTIRQTLDNISGKSEALVLDVDGQPLVESGKVSDAKRWVSDHLPPPQVLYASVFGAQGEDGFVQLDPAARKSVVVRVLGHEHLEEKARAAGERARQAKAQLDTCVARLVDERERGGDVTALEAELDAASKALGEASASLAVAEKTLEEARAQAEQRATEEQARKVALEKRTALATQLGKVAAQFDDVERRRGETAALMAQRDEIRAAAKRIDEIAVQLADHEKRDGIVARLARFDQQIADVEERRHNNAEIIGRAEEIRAAAARLEEIDAALSKLREAHREALAASVAAEQALRTAENEAKAKAAENARLAREVEALTKRVGELRPRVEGAEKALPSAIATENAARGALASVEADLEKAQQMQLSGKDHRISSLRGALVVLRYGDADDPAEHAAGALGDDDAAEQELRELPTRIEALTAQRTAAKRDAEKAIEERQAIERVTRERARLDELADEEASKSLALDASAEEVAAAQRAVGSARAEQERAEVAERATKRAIDPLEEERPRHEPAARKRDRLNAAEVRLEELAEQAKGLADGRAEVVVELDAITVPPPRHELEAERGRLGPTASRLDALNAAAALAGELDAQKQRLTEERSATKVAHDAITVPEVVTPAAYVDGAERQVGVDRASLVEAQTARARAEDALTRAKASAARVAELEAERVRFETDLGDWRLLEQGLGRNGVQALELDAVSPALTEMTNDLLSACFGNRFTVRYDTTAPKKSGKGDKEGFWIWVHDNDAPGPEREARHHSGGEKVWIGEAVDLAIAMLGCQHGGFVNPSIVRDERGAALAEENGPRYVAMLRKAAEMVNAAHVLFVTHDSSLQELADFRIEVGGGKVTVVA